MDISVVIPLLNEEESLRELYEWIHAVMEKHNYSFEVVFVDDGSTDNSWEVIDRLSAIHDNVRAIGFRRNYGKSAALNRAFLVVEGDVVITMDADLQDSPEEIPEMYEMIMKENYDLVSGWKKKRYDPILSKNLPSKLFNRVTRRISGIKLHDFNCGLKAYRRAVVKNVEVYGEMHRYIPVLAKWAGFSRIGEKVVHHSERKYGTSKFGIERFINGFLDLLSLYFVTRFSKRPMHFFGSLGSAFFLGGGIISLVIIINKLVQIAHHTYVRDVTDQPLFYLALLAMVLGTQLFLTGFLAELISRNATDRNKYHIREKIRIDKQI